MMQRFDEFQQALESIQSDIHKVIIGQDAAIRQALIVILSGQHALVEGVPGLATFRRKIEAFESMFTGSRVSG